LICGREVEVKVTTHATGGLTNYDFVLAAKLDEIPVRDGNSEGCAVVAVVLFLPCSNLVAAI